MILYVIGALFSLGLFLHDWESMYEVFGWKWIIPGTLFCVLLWPVFFGVILAQCLQRIR